MQPKESAKQIKNTSAKRSGGALECGSNFSRKLYADTLHRLRITGLLLTLICLVITLLTLLPDLFEERLAYRRIPDLPTQFGNVLTFFTLLSPVLLMMQTFFFLYRRNGSDLYFGLPYTRRCLGLSLTAASLTWSCAVVTLPLAMCAVLIPLSPVFFPMALLGWMLAHHLTTILLVTGCALIGASLSGTPLTGAVIAGMALFLPRLAILVFRCFVVNMSGMLTYNDTNWLLSPALHLPTADVLLLTQGGELPWLLGKTYTQFFQNTPGILYTLVLSAIALAIGLLFFVRRKSEMAGQTLAHSWGRYALHATVMSTVLLLVSYVLCMAYRGYLSYWMADFSLRWVAVAIAVFFVLYLAFQWFRTKSWRGAVQAAPLMALAIVCATAICWGGTAVGRQTRVGLPEADEIASVRFPCEPGDDNLFFNTNGMNLFAGQVSDVRYDEPEIRALAATAMSNYAAMLNEYEVGQTEYPHNGIPITIEVKLTSGGSLRRTVKLPYGGQAERLEQLMLSSPDFMYALRQVPESPLLVMDANGYYPLPIDADTDTIWQTFRAELDALSDLDLVRQTLLWHNLPNIMLDDYERATYPLSISVYAWHGMDLCESTFGVGALTPRTLDACVRVSNRWLGTDYKEALEATDAQGFALNQGGYTLEFTYAIQKNGHTLWRSASLSPLPDWSDRYGYFYTLENSPDRETYEAIRVDEAEKLWDILLRSPLAENGREPLVKVFVSMALYQDKGVYDPVIGTVYLRASEADFAALTEFAQRREQEGIQW